VIVTPFRRTRSLVQPLVACAFTAATACAREQPAPADSASGQPAPAVSAPSCRGDSTPVAGPRAATAGPSGGQVVAITPNCVSEDAWQSCSLERRLIDAGFVLIKKGASPTGVFQVAGTTYMLGPAELHVYLFPSAKARETAIAGIDTVAIAPRGGVATWPTPHTLITSNNLAAVLISDNGRLIERVQNAITAGLPSAAR